MAKEVAVGKRAKISEAQQNMLLAVAGASIFLGVAFSLVSHFVQKISFNIKVIAAQEQSIKAYSDVIRTTGVCMSPNGDVYSNDELEKCDPDAIEVSQIPGTLRANILENLAADEALNSVQKEDDSSCKNPATEKPYTYKELSKVYKEARGGTQLAAASQLIKSCSALRVIPDTLPAFKNEEALLASLNKLFNVSGWQPESLSPSGSTIASDLAPGLNAMSLNLSVEAGTGTTLSVLNNIERSIREFDIKRATIEWGGNNTLKLQAQATAYYVDESAITESIKTIKAGDKK